MDKKLLIQSKKYKGASTIVSARLPEALLADIEKVADKTGRSRNEIIQTCLEFALENMEIH